MNIRNEIKAYIVREGFTMSELVEKLAEQYGWSPSVPNLSDKLRRESLRYKEAVELADAPSAMTSFGRSGDKEDYGEKQNQRYLFQGFGRRS